MFNGLCKAIKVILDLRRNILAQLFWKTPLCSCFLGGEGEGDLGLMSGWKSVKAG